MRSKEKIKKQMKKRDCYGFQYEILLDIRQLLIQINNKQKKINQEDLVCPNCNYAGFDLD